MYTSINKGKNTTSMLTLDASDNVNSCNEPSYDVVSVNHYNQA